MNLVNALQKTHAAIIKTGNAVANQIVKHVQRKLNRSDERSARAIDLRSDVTAAVKTIIETEAELRKDLLVSLKQANRLLIV